MHPVRCARSAGGLWTTLDKVPVLGVTLQNCSMLRLDRVGGGGPAMGNKSFKLAPAVQQAKAPGGPKRLVSFGGVWSNHLLALAATGAHEGLETVGILRGGEVETAMMMEARAWGMPLEKISRAEFAACRSDPAYRMEVARRFVPSRFLLVPVSSYQYVAEGGAGVDAARACGAISEMILHQVPRVGTVALAVGSGTTLAGVAAGMGGSAAEVLGVSALKGEGQETCSRVRGMLSELSEPHAMWRLEEGFHCGGFARATPELQEFILAFESALDVRLEPVYTGKLMYALHVLYREGNLDGSLPVVAVHTGGLQGRRGFAWLDP